MNNLSLYNITNRFVELMDKSENEELTEEEYNQIGEELALQLQQKSSNIIGYYKNTESLIEAIKNEEKRLSDFRKALENKQDKFKQYVKSNMERLSIEKLQTELGTLSIAKSPLSVEIISEAELPQEYKQEVITIKVDKKAIADNFKANGEIPPGVTIHTDNTNLRIK